MKRLRKKAFLRKNSEKHTSVAKATTDSIDFMPGINPRPTARGCFHAKSPKSIPQWLEQYQDRHTQTAHSSYMLKFSGEVTAT
jgi:hypothetical protein